MQSPPSAQRGEPRKHAGDHCGIDRHARDSPSETFLALRGENFDGHRFIAEAVRAAHRPSSSTMLPRCRMDKRLRRCRHAGGVPNARRARADRVRGPVIAITGSTGKTTTKTFAVQALEAAGQAVTATPENENNEIASRSSCSRSKMVTSAWRSSSSGSNIRSRPLVRAAGRYRVLTNIVKPSRNHGSYDASPKRSGTLCRRRAARAQLATSFARTCGVAREARSGSASMRSDRGRHARRDRAR